MPLHYGLARMFEAYCELAGGDAQIFSELADAERWLGLLANPALSDARSAGESVAASSS